MSRAVPWSAAAAAGASLVAVGVVLVVRGAEDRGELVFLSPEQFDVLVTAHQRVRAGRVLLAVGAVLGAGALGWLVVRGRTAGRAVGRVLAAAGVLAAGAVVAGLLVLRAVNSSVLADGVVPPLCTGSPECGDPGAVFPPHAVHGTGMAATVVGALVLGAVAGWLLGRDQRVDQW